GERREADARAGSEQAAREAEDRALEQHDTEHVGAGGADARRDGERALLALRGHREGRSGEQQDEVGAEHERRRGRRVERPRASASAFQYGLTAVTRTLNERAVEDDDA